MACNPIISKPVFGIKEIKIGRESGQLQIADIDLSYKEVANPAYENIEVVI